MVSIELELLVHCSFHLYSGVYLELVTIVSSFYSVEIVVIIDFI